MAKFTQIGMIATLAVGLCASPVVAPFFGSHVSAMAQTSQSGGAGAAGSEVARLRREINDLKERVQYLEQLSNGQLAGVPTFSDTDTLTVRGQRINLYGVIGAGNSQHTQRLMEFVQQNGNTVVCEPVNGRFACVTPTGWDLASVVISNGGARAREDAPPDLKAYEEEARRRRVGIWAQ